MAKPNSTSKIPSAAISDTARPAHREKRTDYITVRVPESTKAQLQALARADQRPLSWFVCKLLQQHCRNGS